MYEGSAFSLGRMNVSMSHVCWLLCYGVKAEPAGNLLHPAQLDCVVRAVAQRRRQPRDCGVADQLGELDGADGPAQVGLGGRGALGVEQRWDWSRSTSSDRESGRAERSPPSRAAS